MLHTSLHLSAEVRLSDCCCRTEGQLPQDCRAPRGTGGSKLTRDNKLLIKVCAEDLPVDQQLQGRECHLHDAPIAHQVPRSTSEDHVSCRGILQKGMLCHLCLGKDDHFVILSRACDGFQCLLVHVSLSVQ